MKIWLAKVFLIIMLTSGLILPVHAYAHELSEFQETLSLDAHLDHEDDSGSCDHCCHFSSHSIGLLLKTTSLINHQTKGILVYRVESYSSQNHPPPYQPPIT